MADAVNANAAMKVSNTTSKISFMTSPIVNKIQGRPKVLNGKMEGAGRQGSKEVSEFSPGL